MRRVYQQKSLAVFLWTILSIIIFAAGFLFFKSIPKKTFFIRFSKVIPVSTDTFKEKIKVYYHGLEVGKVTKTIVAKDMRSVLFRVDIYQKDFNLPANSTAVLEVNGDTGMRYILLLYPKKPSSKIIKNGDVIEGAVPELGRHGYADENVRITRMDALLENSEALTFELAEILKENRKDIRLITKNLSTLTEEIKSLTDDDFQKDVKSTVKNINRTIEDTNKILENGNMTKNISSLIGKANDTMDNVAVMKQDVGAMRQDVRVMRGDVGTMKVDVGAMRKNVSDITEFTNKTEKTLDKVNELTADIKKEDVDQAKRLLVKADCMTDGLNKILGERFLVFKFMFSNPGKEISKCSIISRKCRNKQ